MTAGPAAIPGSSPMAKPVRTHTSCDRARYTGGAARRTQESDESCKLRRPHLPGASNPSGFMAVAPACSSCRSRDDASMPAASAASRRNSMPRMTQRRDASKDAASGMDFTLSSADWNASSPISLCNNAMKSVPRVTGTGRVAPLA